MKANWEVKRLNEVGKIFSGNSINEKVKKQKYTDIKEGLPYIATKDISYNYEIDYKNGINIPEKDLTNFKISHKNSILICAEGGSAGRKMAFNTQDICFVNKLFTLEPSKSVEPRFVYYFYQSENFQKQFKALITGLIGGVSMNKFKEIEIAIPTIQVQKQIVSILDRSFEKIEKAKQTAETNLKNAKELFESYLEEIFSNPKEGWEETKLGVIANFEYGFTDKSKENGDLRYVRITDTSEEGLLTKKNKAYIKASKDSTKFILKNEDLLMARVGASFAKVLFYEDLEPSVFASFLIRINLRENIHHKLYWYFSKSRKYWNQAKALASGSAQPQFNANALANVVFNFPKSIEEQTKIVKKLDALSEQVKKLEVIYQQKLNDLEELKKAILQKAFNGELTRD